MSILHHVELRGSVPAIARWGDGVRCEWELRNDGVAELPVSVYVRVAPASLAEFRCFDGKTRQGRFHGSATLLIPSGLTATLSGVLVPHSTGLHSIRVAVVTRYETIERTHAFRVHNRKRLADLLTFVPTFEMIGQARAT